MHRIESLRSLDVIKVLADPRRLEILRLLMAAPATLTQLGKRLGRSPAWVQHHMLALQNADLVQFDHVRVVGRATEKYYRAAAGGLLLEQLVLPKTKMSVIVFSGSHDPALQAAAGALRAHSLMLTLYVGSLNGMTNLRQGLCHMSGVHLLDESGDYNRAYVRHFFPDREMKLLTLAHRIQGLMVQPGNPKSVHGVRDLVRPDLRFVNRNAGSGTRLWIDRELRRASILPESIQGFGQQVSTHTQAAARIKSGRADAALGLQASAHLAGLDFEPLFEERYDMVVPAEAQALLAPLLDHIQTAAFRRSVNLMTGYNTAHSGELVPI